MAQEKWTLAQLHQHYAAQGKGAEQPPKKPKYGNKKVVVDGITFDSKKEAEIYSGLRAMERQGDIQDLQLQVKFMLRGEDGNILKSDSGRGLFYLADFCFKENGKPVIWDAKGFATRVYLLKKAIMRGMGFKIVEV